MLVYASTPHNVWKSYKLRVHPNSMKFLENFTKRQYGRQNPGGTLTILDDRLALALGANFR